MKALKGYKPSQADVAYKHRSKALKLDWNEGTDEFPKRFTQAISKLLTQPNFLNWYPELNPVELHNQIREYLGLDSKAFVEVFNGSDGFLDYVAKLFCANGKTCTIVGPTYDQFRAYVELYNGEVETVLPDDPYQLDIKKLIPQISKKTSVIYIANPNNPTGEAVKPKDIAYLADTFKKALILADEAYVEFAPEFSFTKLLKKHPNVIVARTMSKAFSLASIRFGYAVSYGPYLPIISSARNKKEVSSFSHMVASIAFRHAKYFTKKAKSITTLKQKTVSALTKLGYDVRGRHGNFFMIHQVEPKTLVSYLEKKMIFVRDRSYLPKLEKSVRITMGTPKQMEIIVKALKSFK